MTSAIEQAMKIAKRQNWGKNKAKEFSSGRFTASQTGAKQEAYRKWKEDQAIANTKKVMKAAKSQKSFEDLIEGK